MSSPTKQQQDAAKSGKTHKRVRSAGSITSMNASNSSFSSLIKNAVKTPSHYRRARIVRKAGTIVQSYVSGLTAKAPYLGSQRAKKEEHQKQQQQQPLLERTEIQVGKLLGEGGFCQVWEVTGFALNPLNDHQLSQSQQQARCELVQSTTSTSTSTSTSGTPKLYALKQLKKRLTRNPPEFTLATADLVVEAQYLANLSHPHILSTRGMTLHGTEAMSSGRYDSYFLLMDRLDDTLDKRIQSWIRGKSEASFDTKLRYCYEIALALQYLHERRIIFRDVKPHNIGFTPFPEDKLQLFDMGLCRELPATVARKKLSTKDDSIENASDIEEQSTTSSVDSSKDEYYLMTIVGTRRYMAIEMFISGRYNCKADVYGWSMTAYELLSLSKPFAALSDTDHQEYVCIQGKRPNVKPLLQQCEAPQGKTPAILKVIRAAWEQYVGKRIDSNTVVQRLERIIQDRQGGDGTIPKGQRHSVREISATDGDSYSSPSDSEFRQLKEHEPDDCEDDDDRSIDALLVDKLTSTSIGGTSRHSRLSTDGTSTRDGSSASASMRWDDSSLNTTDPAGSSGGSLSTINFEEYLKERHGASLRSSKSNNNNSCSMGQLMNSAAAGSSSGSLLNSAATGSSSGSLLGPSFLSSRPRTPPNSGGVVSYPTTLTRIVSGGRDAEGEEDLIE